MKPILLLVIPFLISTTAYASSKLSDKGFPPIVAFNIKSDYSKKAASLVPDSTKIEDLIITIQKDQSFQFKIFSKKLAIVPFSYVPNTPENGENV
jgi:hypothetical protein